MPYHHTTHHTTCLLVTLVALLAPLALSPVSGAEQPSVAPVASGWGLEPGPLTVSTAGVQALTLVMTDADGVRTELVFTLWTTRRNVVEEAGRSTAAVGRAAADFAQLVASARVLLPSAAPGMPRHVPAPGALPGTNPGLGPRSGGCPNRHGELIIIFKGDDATAPVNVVLPLPRLHAQSQAAMLVRAALADAARLCEPVAAGRMP